MNSSASIVAEYRYDPWGKLISTTGDTTLAELNPLRYKGYYYDTETGFYYLQTRYYDPEIGRFINADSFTTTDINGLLSTNMFAYCENDPVNDSDPTGEFGHIIVGGLQIMNNIQNGAKLTEGLAVAAISGAITGGAAASGLGRLGQAAVGAVTSGLSYLATTPSEKLDFSTGVKVAICGAISGALSGNGLTHDSKVAGQISIINSNVHALKTSYKAVRTVYTNLGRIANNIGKTIGDYLTYTFLGNLASNYVNRSK